MSGKNFTLRAAAMVQIFLMSFSFLLPVSANKGKNRSVETVFSNTTPVTISSPTNGVTTPGALYPSNISVSGMTGTITRLEITLDGITHTRMNDLDFLLVGPGGQKYIFMSDLPVNNPNASNVQDRIYTFADDAPTSFPNLPYSGFYRPFNNGTTDTFPSPAPAGPYSHGGVATLGSVFNGTDPNGTWSLYAVDDASGTSSAAGRVNAGWALNVTTDGAPTKFTNTSTISFNDKIAASSPYGTGISVAGMTGVISDINVTLNDFSHTRPEDVDILLVSPDGRGTVIMSDAGGGTAATNVNVTLDDSASTFISIPLVSGTFVPTDNASSGFPDEFQHPAPYAFYTLSNAKLSVFNGFSPNGEWKLYIIDDEFNENGSLAGGWSIDITTIPTPAPPSPTCSGPSFTPANFATGTNPTNLAVADFNNDGDADVAVTNQLSNNVSVLLGGGDGTLGTQATFAAGTGPYSVVAGKFNADTNFDLAVANSSSNNVSILLGNGDGTFGSATNFAVGTNPLSVTAADFNGDTNLDLAVANFGSFFSGSVTILLGNGSGGFGAGNPVITRSQPAYVTAADLNADTFADLVVANFGANSVSTFLGSGTGTFQLSQNLSVGTGPVAVEVADLGLGTAGVDLAVANYNSDSITTCNSLGSGTFSCNGGTQPAGGPNPISITSADFIGGGLTTLATALSGSNSVRLISTNVNVGQNPNAVEAADFNGDGKPDFVTANSGSNTVSVALNVCAGAPRGIKDFTGDQKTDYAVYRPGDGGWYNYNFSPVALPMAIQFARPTDRIVPADYDGDGKTDLGYYRPTTGAWYTKTVAGATINYLNFGLAEDIPAPADYDGDGKADIAVFRPSDGNWYIRKSTDNSLYTFHWGESGDQPVPGDYDEDGKDDIAIFRPSTGDWWIYYSATSTFTAIHWGATGDRPVQGDYDGDGKTDTAVYRPSDGSWYVLRSSDSSWFAGPWGTTGDIPVPGDYEGDGKYDFAVYRPSEGRWYISESSDGGYVAFNWGTATDIPIPSTTVP